MPTGQVLLSYLSHCQRQVVIFLIAGSFCVQPLVMFSMIAGINLVSPGMREGTRPGGFCIPDIKVERQISFAGIICLHPYRFVIWQLYGAGIIETTNPLQRTEAMIEGTVFLHEDNYMSGIEVSTANTGIYSKRFLNG